MIFVLCQGSSDSDGIDGGKWLPTQSKDSPQSEIFTRGILRLKSFRFQQKLIRNKLIC